MTSYALFVKYQQIVCKELLTNKTAVKLLVYKIVHYTIYSHIRNINTYSPSQYYNMYNILYHTTLNTCSTILLVNCRAYNKLMFTLYNPAGS